MKVVHLITGNVTERVILQVLSLCKEQKELGIYSKLWIISSDPNVRVPPTDIAVSFFSTRRLSPVFSHTLNSAFQSTSADTSFHLHSTPGFWEKMLCNHICEKGFRLILNFLECEQKYSFMTKLSYEVYGRKMTDKAFTVSAEDPWIKERLQKGSIGEKLIGVPLAHLKKEGAMGIVMNSSHYTTFAYYGIFDGKQDPLQKMLQGFSKYLNKLKGLGRLMLVGRASAITIQFLKKKALDYGLQNKISFHFNHKDEMGLLNQSDYVINVGGSGQEVPYIQKAILMQKPCIIPVDHPATQEFGVESLFMLIRKRKVNFFASTFIQAERLFGKPAYSNLQTLIRSKVDHFWSKSSRLVFFRQLYVHRSCS